MTDLQVGDPVLAYAPGCFGLYLRAPAAWVVPRPAGLTPEQAATLPTAYVTAWHALVQRGRLRAGESVLIHAAAGGVGLAAVHIARLLGATVYATAGSEAKRDYLRALGLAGVMDSRSLDFADRVLDATGGRGVDLLLNSLGGEFLVDCLTSNST